MNIIQWIFALVQRFVPVPPIDFASMQNEANEWHSKVLVPPKEKSLNAFEKWYKEYGTKWYFRLLLSIMYIPVSIWIGSTLNEINNPMTKELHDDKKW